MNEQDIFEAALELEGDHRAAFLNGACGSDAGLRRRVESLLQFHDNAGDFFETPAAEIVGTAPQPTITERAGTIIGQYKLLQQIGEGGMGVVYRAEQQEPVRRVVALKIVRPGMDTRDVVARFEIERQALAMMDHPKLP